MEAAPAYRIEREQWVDRPVDEVFAFFSDATNLEAITPPWLRFSVLTPRPIAMHPGALVEYRLGWHGFPLRWTTRIESWEPPHRFVDTQLHGPYRLWHHTHTFEPRDGGTLIRDEVLYRLPLGPLGAIAHRLSVRRDVESIFAYRARRIGELFGHVPGRGGSDRAITDGGLTGEGPAASRSDPAYNRPGSTGPCPGSDRGRNHDGGGGP